MLQIKLLKLSTRLYKYVLKLLLKSVQKADRRAYRRMEKEQLTADRLEKYAAELKKAAQRNRQNAGTIYAEKALHVNSAVNTIYNLTDDTQKNIQGVL